MAEETLIVLCAFVAAPIHGNIVDSIIVFVNDAKTSASAALHKYPSYLRKFLGYCTFGMMADSLHDTTTATRLALALKRLRARLREESRRSAPELSLSQLSILQRLRAEGPATAASLAAAEHVSQQAIAQSLAPLRSAGLIGSTPDPGDRRKTLIAISEAGLELRESIIASRNSWLARAIDATIDDRERVALGGAIDLLERLADAQP